MEVRYGLGPIVAFALFGDLVFLLRLLGGFSGVCTVVAVWGSADAALSFVVSFVSSAVVVIMLRNFG